MTFARSRIDAHNNGDCDATTCPLCDLEIEEERAYNGYDDVSTHEVYYLADEPETWVAEPCECLSTVDHDLGQEVWDA